MQREQDEKTVSSLHAIQESCCYYVLAQESFSLALEVFLLKLQSVCSSKNWSRFKSSDSWACLSRF